MGINVDIMQAGTIKMMEKSAIKTGGLKKVELPILVSLIEHPKYGYILVDSGISQNYFDQIDDLSFLVSKLYNKIELDDMSIAEQLKSKGIKETDIRYIILTHLHVEQVGGCLDFPNAIFFASNEAFDELESLNELKAAKAGYLRSLLPEDFGKKTYFFEDKPLATLPVAASRFKKVFDLLGDESILAVELPGHAAGHYGIFLNLGGNRYRFILGDAAYLNKSVLTNKGPGGFGFGAFNSKDYNETLNNLFLFSKKYSTIELSAGKCPKAFKLLSKLNNVGTEISEEVVPEKKEIKKSDITSRFMM